VEAELHAYARVQQVPLDTDPLMWWKQHVQEFPRLARMDRQYLAVLATSASPERLFSSVGLVTPTPVIVTDNHQHMDCGLYTYMTSYLAQVYRLSINY